MARVTYGDRLQTLIDGGELTSRDLAFVSSLLSYYKSKRKLTVGRVRCLKELEERYKPANVVRTMTMNADVLKRLKVLKLRVAPNSWAGGFVSSLADQAKSGHTLTGPQLSTLDRIEAEHNDAAMLARINYSRDYENNKDGMKDKALVLARYYSSTGYYSLAVHLIDSGSMPTEKQYRKMSENKYAEKVWAAHCAEPKFKVGTMVALRAGRGYNSKACVVISTNEAIISACKGAKRYKLLPIGASTCILMEERHLKAVREKKKK